VCIRVTGFSWAPGPRVSMASAALPDWIDDAETRSRLLGEYNIRSSPFDFPKKGKYFSKKSKAFLFFFRRVSFRTVSYNCLTP